MKIKKYIVDSMPDAMQQIRTELGNNAVILNTKKVKTGGWFGFFAKQQIEVIAAIDQEKSSGKERARVPDKTSLERATEPEPISRKLAIVQQPTSSSGLEQRRAMQHASVAPSSQLSLVQQDALVQEMQEMKKVIRSMVLGQAEQLPEAVREIDQRLRQHELAEAIRSDIVTTVLQELEGQEPAYPKKDVLRVARQRLAKFIQESNKQVEIIESITHAKVICFVGPTGVGKTTTIAKLAAKLMLQQQKKVGFITCDTYRIAAVEQLRTYANIMQIPLEVVFAPEELSLAMEKLQHCDVILMDTAGRNYKQQEYISELNELVADRSEIQIQIVLSLTSKYEDMLMIMEQFKQLKLNGLILTKVDETNSYGAIINLIQRYAVPLAFMTNGQNVPDDMILVQPDTIVDLLLGEWVYEGSS